MWVALVPFSASLLGKYGGQQISVIIYACHMIIASLTLSWLWWHASSKPHLVDPSLDARLREYNHLRTLIAPSVFGLSIAISYIDVHATEYSWLLLFLIRPALRWYVMHDRRPSV